MIHGKRGERDVSNTRIAGTDVSDLGDHHMGFRERGDTVVVGPPFTEAGSNERKVMSHLQTLLHWFTQNPLSAATIFFGGAIVAVTLYTLVHDYHVLINQD